MKVDSYNWFSSSFNIFFLFNLEEMSMTRRFMTKIPNFKSCKRHVHQKRKEWQILQFYFIYFLSKINKKNSMLYKLKSSKLSKTLPFFNSVRSKWSHWGDVLAIPFFAMLCYYFYTHPQKSFFEWILLKLKSWIHLIRAIEWSIRIQAWLIMLSK